MRRIFASMLLTAASLGVAMGQQTDHEKHHQTDQPKGDKTGSMMPMMESMKPMMMEMHQRHMAQNNQWTVAGDAVFALRGDQLLKFDANLKLTKQVDLPKATPLASGESSEHAKHHASEVTASGANDESSSKGESKMQKMQRMKQMMSKMHSALARKIEVTPDAVFVSQGNTLLKYDHDLELQAQSEPAEGNSGMKCPMCEQMMKQKKKKVKASN